MNIRRFFSYIVVAVLGAVLWTTWNKEHPSSKEQNIQTNATTSTSSSPFVPQTPPTSKSHTSQENPPSLQQTNGVVDVKTDLLAVKISLNGGNIVETNLLKYPQSISDPTPVKILSSDEANFYQAESGITNTSKEGKTETLQYQTSQMSYSLLPDANQVVVSLRTQTPNGLIVTKNYVFEKNSYAIKESYLIKNTASQAWTGSLYTQLVRKKPEVEHHLFYARSYDGAAVSSPERPYYKLTYDAMDKANYNSSNKGGWVAMQQQYFLSAWIPANPEGMNQFYSAVTPAIGSNIYIIGVLSNLTIAPGDTGTGGATLYVGPEIAKNLTPLAPGLDRTIDYGWLWWISIAIFWLMSVIYSVVHNWGWTIIITTILIKFILYPLSATSFRSMAKMRELQPKMQQLKERYADDRQAMSRATMELYRNEKINPLGGCLPMLIQIPIFIALYYVIIESVQLRQAPFIFWIQDLSVKDPFYVLPILMGISMLIQQRLTPSSPDPAQARMMMFIPVVFTVFFLNFPAGLTLYWLVNNCVQILQQWYVTKTFEAHKEKKAKAKKKHMKK